MNLEQAKAKLDSVSKSTAIKHPKVLVSELCVVVKFLLDEIDRIKTPIVSVLSEISSEDVRRKPILFPMREPQSPPPHPPYPKEEGPRKIRSGNAGDTE